MDEDDSLAPLVDALTGAMSAVLLVSMFLMLSTVNDVSESLKSYGNQSLLENEYIINDALERKAPNIMLEKNSISFSNSFYLTDEQRETLIQYFKDNVPSQIKISSNDGVNINTYNLLLFLSEVGLDEYIDNIDLKYETSSNDRNLTYITWD